MLKLTMCALSILLCVCGYAVLSESVKGIYKESHTKFLQNEETVKEFSQYSLVTPIIHHHSKRTLSESNLQKPVEALKIEIPLDSYNNLTVDLVLNKQLIPGGYFTKVQQNGINKITKPTPKNTQLCHYTGKVRNKSDSWVALSTCDGLSGVIYNGKEMYYIEKKKNENENVHFLYRHKDLINNNRSCGFQDDKYHYKEKFRFKREDGNKTPKLRPYNYNSQSRYVELILVVDNAKYKELDSSVKKVEEYCKNIANIMNGIYSSLDMFISLVGVVVWSEKDEIDLYLNPETTLSKFLRYRREHLVKTHPHDNAQLITKTIFENGVINKSLRKLMCSWEYSGGITRDFSPVAGLVAASVAHTLGHNLGMNDDSDRCECPDEKCIMSSNYGSVVPTHWSSCSKDALILSFEHGLDHCLKNVPNSLFQSPNCGNGFVEEEEECDCGLPEFCNSNCCDPNTCKFSINSTCANGECCDLKTCQLKKPGNLCRKATNECDLPEYCTGQSEYCPSDVYKMDSEVCQSGNGYCYQGRCGMHSDQCRLLWGKFSSPVESCFIMNTKGNKLGHCGYDRLNGTFRACSQEDIFCGVLHCQFTSEKGLLYGFESTAKLSTGFVAQSGSVVQCKTATIDVGLGDTDPGMVPNGAKCGENKMCVDQKCVDVTSWREGHTCVNNCSNHGWCNNLGHCHWAPGYSRPDCKDSCHGGSIDSGPAYSYPEVNLLLA